jgi:type I restriction enzyme M protein
LEQANPDLQGAVIGVDFTQIEPWDSGRRDRILKQLVEGMSGMPPLSSARLVGEGYDHLVTMFAERTGKGENGELFLSIPLARLMVDLLDPRDGMWVCDPVCRAGRALVACAAEAEERRIDLTLHGQEQSSQLVGLCKMNLLLHGAGEVKIDRGNALRSPILASSGDLVRYDRVITAPPINLQHWGAEDAAADPFHRFPVVPPKHNADFAYILHALAILEDGGRAVVLTDRGVLFRQGGEERIRQVLLEADNLEAIVGLPGGLLYGTHIPATLLVLRKGTSARRGKVLFAELHRSAERKSRNEALRFEDAEALREVVLGFVSRPDLSVVVDTDAVSRNQWNLSPSRYLPQRAVSAVMDPRDAIDSIRVTEAERDEAASRVDALIQELTARLNL